MSSLHLGDIIVYHGIVGGERGLCLIVGIWYLQFNNEEPDYRQILSIENSSIQQRAINLNDEGEFWSRINDRT